MVFEKVPVIRELISPDFFVPFTLLRSFVPPSLKTLIGKYRYQSGSLSVPIVFRFCMRHTSHKPPGIGFLLLRDLPPYPFHEDTKM